MFDRLKNKIKLKKVKASINLRKFNSIQEKFSIQMIEKIKTKVDNDKRMLHVNEIYMSLENEDLLNSLAHNGTFEEYMNDYFDMDFLYMEIHDKFEQLTGRNIRYDQGSKKGYIIKYKNRIILRNLIFKDDFYSGYDSLIELERIQKSLIKSTQKLKLYIDKTTEKDPRGELLFIELSKQRSYREQYNHIINQLKRILIILNELISKRKEKQNKVKSLIIPIFSLIIPILIFLPDYMGYKKIEDDNIYRLNKWQQIAYNEAIEKLDYSDFRLILNEDSQDLDINEDYIYVIKKNEILEDIKSDKVGKRVLTIKILFLIFLVLSIFIIYLLF